jgi:uncharacterized membrane protein
LLNIFIAAIIHISRVVRQLKSKHDNNHLQALVIYLIITISVPLAITDN